MDNPIARRGQVTISHASPSVFRFLASLPSYHKFLNNGGAIFEATRHSIEAYERAFPNLAIEDADGTIARLKASVAPVVQHKRLAPQDAAKSQPFNHQTNAVDIALSRDYFAFFHDMGLSKSATMIYIAAELYARKLIDRILVVTTKRGLPQFKNEQLPLWMPPSIKYIAEQVPPSAKKRELKYPGERLMIAFATPGAFQSTNQTNKIIEFFKKGPFALLIDESQNFKGWSTSRVDNMVRLLNEARPIKRFIFSGEPQPNGLEDLFAQFYLLDPNIIGHSTKQSFENQYVVKGGYQLSEIVDYKNVSELTSRIAPHSEYIKITDVRDMPPQIREIRKFEPTSEQQEKYAQVKRELVVEVNIALESKDPEIIRRTCANAASKLVVMAQISNGFFYSDLMPGQEEGDPRHIHRITTERAEFVLEELVPKNQKTIIYARFHQDLQILKEVMESMNLKGVEISGRLNDKQCEANKLLFQSTASGSPTILYATTASGGEALNLQIANRTIYYSNSYNWGHRIQSERRTWRTGQESTCYYTDIVGMPIDRMIIRNLVEKQDLAGQVRLAVNMARLIEEV